MRKGFSSCAVLLMAAMLVLATQHASASKTTNSKPTGNKPSKHFTLPKVDVPRTYAELTVEGWQEWLDFMTATVQRRSSANGVTIMRSDRTPGPRNRRMLAQSSQELLYNGGPVMIDTVNVYMIYVMNKDAVGSSDAWQWTQWPDYLVSNLASSSRWNINTLYYDSNNNYVSGSIALAQSTFVTIPSGWSLLSSADVQNLVEFVLGKELLPVDNDNGIYVVAVAPNTGADMDPQYCAAPNVKDSYCAWHTYGVSDTYGSLKYAFVPVSGGSECPNGCSVDDSWYPIGSSSPTGNPHFDRFLSSVVHELEETVTDPFVNTNPGWSTADGEENADLCSGNYGEVSTTTNNQGETVAYNSVVGEAPLMLQTGYDIDISQCVNQL